MPLSKADKERGFKFIEPPPERSMRKRTPESAPRLFEWLTENGYVEPIKTVRRGSGGSAGSASSTGGGLGRSGAGKKKKKNSPF